LTEADAFDVRDTVAIVTGGSRGLGRALSLGLARAGANVVVTSRKLENCQGVADEARTFGVEALPLACHVGHWDELEALVDAVHRHFGRVDVLVNNAGIGPVAASMLEVSERLYESTMNVNFKGPFRLACLVGSRMVASGSGGSIINISSGAANHASPRTPIYGAAKAALNAVTTALAIEYGPTVRCNAIGLGPTETDVNVHWFRSRGFQRTAQANMALRRGAQPEEIVGTVLYLASAASSFTTGAVLQVDGGIYGRLETSGE
jgi:NAD(P)-dependent dehydrogenase (short-subunit alcohol dehydrogenase family)